MFDHGISYEGDLIDLGIEHGIVEKQGSWLSLGEVRLGQGREHAKTFLAENKDLAEELRLAIIRKVTAPPAVPSAVPSAAPSAAPPAKEAGE